MIENGKIFKGGVRKRKLKRYLRYAYASASFKVKVNTFKMYTSEDEDETEKPTYDMRFKNPSAFLLAGATQSGKTTFTLNLLRNVDDMFQKPACKLNVVYFFRDWQPAFDIFKKEGIVHKWVNRLPTTTDIDNYTSGFLDTGSIFVIDDFQEELNTDTVQIFTNKCHHRNCIVILLAQNIFCPNKGFRTISLNSTYVLLFKNPRDASQINCFAKQFSPGDNAWLIKAFKEATRKPHSYMLFDSHQDTPDWARIRSHLLPHELPIRVYAQRA